METLLVVAVILTALAVIVQAGMLVSMYLLSRRITGKAELLMNDSRRLIAPLESITNNLKAASNDVAESGKIARAQVAQIQQMLNETRENVRGHIADVRERVLDTVDEARTVVMRPVRQYAAFANAIAAGISTFFKARKPEPAETAETEVKAEVIIIDREDPAA